MHQSEHWRLGTGPRAHRWNTLSATTIIHSALDGCARYIFEQLTYFLPSRASAQDELMSGSPRRKNISKLFKDASGVTIERAMDYDCGAGCVPAERPWG